MTEKIDFTFNSENVSDSKTYQLASGYISQTTILFEKENITAVIQAKGSISFSDTEGNLLSSGSVPPAKGGREVYEEICCSVKNNSIILEFPVYKWIDNYPNCDGEYDRWDTIKAGSHILTFDISDHSVI